MINILKNKRSRPTSRQSGFLGLILIIVVALLLISYFFDLSVSEIIDWFKGLFS